MAEKPDVQPVTRTRSGRTVRPTPRMAEYIQQLKQEQSQGGELSDSQWETMDNDAVSQTSRKQVITSLEQKRLEITKEMLRLDVLKLENELKLKELQLKKQEQTLKDNAVYAKTPRDPVPRSPPFMSTPAAPGLNKHVDFETYGDYLPSTIHEANQGEGERLNPNAPSFISKNYVPAEVMRASNENVSDRLNMQYTPYGQQSVQPQSPTLPHETVLLTKLADMLSHRQDSLPRMEPDVFDGNLLKFPSWMRSFETLIEHRTQSDTERLYYLHKYTTGSPRQAVQGFLALEGVDIYARAKYTLVQRYGDKFKISEAFRRQLDNWPNIKPGDGESLQKFSDFVQQCQTAMTSISYLRSLDNPEENRKLLRKLPRYVTDRWNRIVDKWLYGTESQRREHGPFFEGQYPPFSEFCRFLCDEARIACGPGNLHTPDKREEKYQGKNNARGKTWTFSAQTQEAKPQNTTTQGTTDAKHTYPGGNGRPPSVCVMCKGKHATDKCFKFLKLSAEERKAFARGNGLCYGCVRKGHLYKDCRRRNPSLMRDEAAPLPQSQDNAAAQVNQTEAVEATVHMTVNKIQHSSKSSDDSVTHHAMILPVVIHHHDDPRTRVTTYALLDSQSSASFMSEGLLKSLNVRSQGNVQPVDLELTTVLNKGNIKSQKVHGLVIKGLHENTELSLPGTYTRSTIPADRSLIPRPETVRQWPHLEAVAKELLPIDQNIDVGLLIGFDCSAALLPKEVAANADHEPYGVRTVLGWSVSGPVGLNQATDPSEPSNPFVFRTQVKEVTIAQVRSVFDQDFHDGPEKPLSIQDSRFLTQLAEGTKRRDDGHLELPLPFKEKGTKLPNNKTMAVKRLNSLRWKLIKDENYKRDYTTFMSQVIERGYAEKVPPGSSNDQSGSVWYIPHHGVYHPKKRDKIRVVFDCSAEFEGQSLNQHLLPGPDVINNLTGILCRFRQERIGFVCDIEAMFHQVGVDVTDRDFLRFLWWEDGDLSKDPIEYRMTVHLFGATSSPGCAIFALKTTAEEKEAEYGKEASEFLKRDFYVDDGIKSMSTAEDALQLIDSTRKMCQSNGFNLRKFASNSKEVLSALPSEILVTDLQELDITHEHLPVERTLGIQWNIQSDTFQFSIVLQDKPFTRRGILSTISSIYDPLGLVAPFLLTGKQLLKELCQDNSEWDEEVPDHIKVRWELWRKQLIDLANLRIPRCYKDPELAQLKRIELHHFSDASQDGYGQCSYIRQIDVNDSVSCSLAFSKAKVTPNKAVTIPRLELTAALLSVKVSNFLNKELDYNNIVNVYWTDSTVVLGYIANEAKRFHVFVANRIQQIRDHTSVDQWNHVESKQNPADNASRGMSAKEIINSELWWKGPKFLQTTAPLPITDQPPGLKEDDPEIKRVTTHTTTIKQRAGQLCDMLTRLEYFSDWQRAKRAVAVCLRLKQMLKTRTVKWKPVQSMTHQALKTKIQQDYDPINTAELQEAEKAIIQLVQQREFPKECKIIGDLAKQVQSPNGRQSKHIKRKSSLWKLDPFLGDDGLIRVGGRTRHADLPREIVHPVVLPRRGHVTRLIIAHFHEKTAHSGRNTTLNEIRASGFWIVKGRAAVASFLWKCVLCRKYRGNPAGQKMADLPVDRMDNAPPFTYTGVEVFGPFYVKEGRSEKKRWGALFMCLVSRAIHIEIANTLTTDSFLNCYRRFIGRRGPIRQLRCDRGTNFVGAKGELQAALQEMDQDEITQELLKDSCDWFNFKFNVPYASHMGGVWERMIRSVRNVLTVLLDNHGSQLDDELLRTLMVESEAIVNSRPLTYADMTSPDSAEPLTPSQLLTLKSKVVFPLPGKFVKEDMYSRRRWRRVQFLANEFWTRWRREFLPTLQERSKWTVTKDNIKEGDIVLLTDGNVPRCKWPRGKVVDATPDDDHLVRKVKVQTSTSTFERPIHKLVLLFRPGFPIEEPQVEEQV